MSNELLFPENELIIKLYEFLISPQLSNYTLNPFPLEITNISNICISTLSTSIIHIDINSINCQDGMAFIYVVSCDFNKRVGWEGGSQSNQKHDKGGSWMRWHFPFFTGFNEYEILTERNEWTNYKHPAVFLRQLIHYVYDLIKGWLRNNNVEQ